MQIKLEYDDESAVTQALEQIAKNAEVGETGEKATVEDVADEAVRQFTAQQIQQLITRR